jgi:membrane AbrB-like protein
LDASSFQQKASLPKWALLLALSAVLVLFLELFALPASLLIGPMVAAIVLALTVGKGQLRIPYWPLQFGQVLVGLLMARNITPDILGTMAKDAPLFFVFIVSVIAIAFAALCCYAVFRFRIQGGNIVIPLIGGALLQGFGLLKIELPTWILALSYALIGWSIGLRFTRSIIEHAARALPRVSASIIILMALCGCMALALHKFAGIDPLTAYLATSPGGADSVAIIAASSDVDVPFVMAMQTGRFMMILLIGPALARFIARRSNLAENAA